jgi:hypothetical protein
MSAISPIASVPRKLLDIFKKYPDVVVSLKPCGSCPKIGSGEMSACICANYHNFKTNPALHEQIAGLSMELINRNLRNTGFEYRGTTVDPACFLKSFLVHTVSGNQTQVVITLNESLPGHVIRSHLLQLMALTNVPLGQCLANNWGRIVIFSFRLNTNGDGVAAATVTVRRATDVVIDFLDPAYDFYTPEGAFNSGAFSQYVFNQERGFNIRNRRTACPICMETLMPGNPFVYIERLPNGVPQDCYCPGCLLPWIRSRGTSPLTRVPFRESDIMTGIIPSLSQQMRFVPEIEVQRARGFVADPMDPLHRTQTVPAQSDVERREENSRTLSTMVAVLQRTMSC